VAFEGGQPSGQHGPLDRRAGAADRRGRRGTCVADLVDSAVNNRLIQRASESHGDEFIIVRQWCMCAFISDVRRVVRRSGHWSADRSAVVAPPG